MALNYLSTSNGSAVMKILLSIWLFMIAAADELPPALPADPANSGVFAEENVRAFVLHQIELFVTDCEKWADTFAWNQSAKLCDGYVKECIFDYEGAVASCRRDTQGGSKVFHHENRTVLPRWYVDTNGFPVPMYTDVAVKGKDTLCQILEQDFGFGRFTPICYDYVQLNSYIENPSKQPFGLDTILWDGMYNIGIGTCSGYPPVQCDDNATIEMMDDLPSNSTAESGGYGPFVTRRHVVAWVAWIAVGILIVA